MLRRPGDVETALIGHLHHFQRVARDLLHVEAVVYTLKIDGQLKLHLILRCDPVPIDDERNGDLDCRNSDAAIVFSSVVQLPEMKRPASAAGH
jgi:hypothetical protein